MAFTVSRSRVTPQQGRFVAIAVSSNGANTIMAGEANKVYVVMAYNFMANGTVNAKWQSASTDITGLSYLVVNTGKVVPFSPEGWFQTNPGEDLVLNLSAGVAVGGECVVNVITVPNLG